MRPTLQAAALIVLPIVLSAPLPASAQPARPSRPAQAPAVPAPVAPAPGAPATDAAAVPSAPQQTTASFADWTLRCTRLPPPTGGGPTAVAGTGGHSCEVVQGIQRDERPVAQVAFGRPGRGQPMQLTILVPVNVGLGAGPTLLGARDGEAPLELTWRRCLPAGCIADARSPDEVLSRLRNWSEPGRITFTDGLGRSAALPFSARGLAPALDALAREDGG